MSLWTLFAIALALAMDAFAVSIASGIAIQHMRIRHALTIAAWFGFFQALMPYLGWLGGVRLKDAIGSFDHWVAFVLLAFVGSKMIYEAFKMESVEEKTDPLNVYVLFGLSVATSIDALATGFTFALLNMAIVTPILVIGLVTFVVSLAGVWIGDKGGHFFEKKIEIVGGLILIGIGLKFLFDHLL